MRNKEESKSLCIKKRVLDCGMSTTLLIILTATLIKAYERKCPDPSQWQLHARTKCSVERNYICLLYLSITNTSRYEALCGEEDKSEPGGKLVLRPFKDFAECDLHRYQPLVFTTAGNSDCVYQKSKCNEDGQVVFNNGTVVRDIRCRCDYKNGYTFVTKPKNLCYCIPSEEDCSCYKTKCLPECSKRGSCCGAGYNIDTLECHMSDDCCPVTEVAKGWKVLKKEKRCENGWLEYCNYCYFVPGVLLSWEDARNFCSRVNGFLIRIDSQAEYNWIVTELNKIPVSAAYVWLAAIRSNGLFVWRGVNGNDIPISTSFWSSGEPSGPADVADCAGIYINNALWDDIRCTGLYQFVCKRLIPDS